MGDCVAFWVTERSGVAQKATPRKLSRGLVVQRRMQSLVIVALAPFFAQHFCLGQAAEAFHVEQFVSQAAVEALAVGVLPRAAGLDVARFKTLLRDPVPDLLRDELGGRCRCGYTSVLRVGPPLPPAPGPHQRTPCAVPLPVPRSRA